MAGFRAGYSLASKLANELGGRPRRDGLLVRGSAACSWAADEEAGDLHGPAVTTEAEGKVVLGQGGRVGQVQQRRDRRGFQLRPRPAAIRLVVRGHRVAVELEGETVARAGGSH